MNTACSIALDSLSIVYIIILLLSLGYQHPREFFNAQYSRLSLAVCLFLALDLAYMLLLGHAAPIYRLLAKLVKNFYFLLNALVAWLWCRYVGFLVRDERFKTQPPHLICSAILAVNAILVAINFFTDFLFSISPDGVFVVNTVPMLCFTVLNYLSTVVSVAVLIRGRQNVGKNKFLSLLLFPLIPMCAELVQLFFRPCSLICVYSISVLLTSQVSQRGTLYTDELTGLSNRWLLSKALGKWLSHPRGRYVCGLMLDLDNLKYINDTYGHAAGDNALVELAGVIREIRRRGLVAVRYGGDEFILLWRANDAQDVHTAEQTLAFRKELFNRGLPAHKKIDFSVGCFSCSDREPCTPEDFLQRLDDSMYTRKNAKKQALLRASRNNEF